MPTSDRPRRVAREVVVVVRCVSCKAQREIHAGEVAPDDVPMCSHCYSPMVAVKAIARARREGGR